MKFLILTVSCALMTTLLISCNPDGSSDPAPVEPLAPIELPKADQSPPAPAIKFGRSCNDIADFISINDSPDIKNLMSDLAFISSGWSADELAICLDKELTLICDEDSKCKITKKENNL